MAPAPPAGGELPGKKKPLPTKKKKEEESSDDDDDDDDQEEEEAGRAPTRDVMFPGGAETQVCRWPFRVNEWTEAPVHRRGVHCTLPPVVRMFCTSE